MLMEHPCYNREWGNAEMGLAGYLDLIIAPSFRVFCDLFPELAFLERNLHK